MAETELLQKISDDLDFLKNKVERIEVDVEEINIDLHREVRKEYLDKLLEIEKAGFISEEEFTKEIAE